MRASLTVAFVVMLMSWIGFVFAQPRAPEIEWSRMYGGRRDDFCSSVRRTSDGGYLLAGFTEREDGGEDFWLVRTNAVGDCLWSRTYGGVGVLECEAMELTADGGCIMAGSALVSSDRQLDFLVVKTDADGDSQWSRSFGGVGDDVCRAVLQAADGGYVLAGWTDSYGAGGFDFWLVKTDSLGDSLWSRTFGGPSNEGCLCARKMADGGYVFGGGTWSFGAGACDIWLVKTDANGDSQWSRTLGGGGSEISYDMQHTADGGFVLAGARDDPADPLLSGALLLKTDAVGDCLWSQRFGSPGDIALGVEQTAEAGYVVVTATTFTPGDVDAEVIRTNSVGDSVWRLNFRRLGHNVLFDIHQTVDGGFAFAGYADDAEHVFTDMWLVKTGPELSAATQHLAQDFTFLTNYPNPFNARTTLEFVVPRRSQVMIRAVDLLGREVGLISDALYAPGHHAIPWECRNCASGTYWIMMTGDGFQLVRKTILVR